MHFAYNASEMCTVHSVTEMHAVQGEIRIFHLRIYNLMFWLIIKEGLSIETKDKLAATPDLSYFMQN